MAAAGVSGGGGALPHLDRIQQSFGREHDLSAVQAHVGGSAAEASQAIGASAYATGNAVAFKEAPDLHLAAHEAAHVVQQRSGVQLSGGVGRDGDEYERNADAVADRVVAGESAADLLPRGRDVSGQAAVQGAGLEVQMRRTPGRARVSDGTYAIQSSADNPVARGTSITYTFEQLRPAMSAAGSRERIEWSVENDPASAQQGGRGYQQVIQGPRNARSWTLRAGYTGTHRIRARLYLNDQQLGELVFAQTVVSETQAPLEVTVIDGGDHVGWMAGATRIGEIYMTDVASMVRNVLRLIGARKMSRLNILDHGNPQGIQIGSDWITTATLATYRGTLAQLNGHFTDAGMVHLQHCNIGQNHPLMRSLAQIWGVSVIAGTGAHNPVYRFNFGDYEQCDPDDRCTSDVPRP